MMTHIVRIFLCVFLACFAVYPAVTSASSILGQEKKLLNYTKNNWVTFRNYNGRQLIYFTHIEVYRCGLKRVKYSINSDALDREWELDPCDPKKPHEFNITAENLPYVSLPLGSAQSISIQLTFSDGSKSEIVRLKP